MSPQCPLLFLHAQYFLFCFISEALQVLQSSSRNVPKIVCLMFISYHIEVCLVGKDTIRSNAVLISVPCARRYLILICVFAGKVHFATTWRQFWDTSNCVFASVKWLILRRSSGSCCWFHVCLQVACKCL